MAHGDWLVAAQVAALVGVAVPGRARWSLPRSVRAAATTAVVVGSAFAGSAIAQHGRQITPRVAPPEGAHLLTTGAYGVSRHPIYAGLLLGAAGVAVLQRRAVPLIAAAALGVVLREKTRREDTELAARFGASYIEYRAAGFLPSAPRSA